MKKIVVVSLMISSFIQASEFKILDISMGDKRSSLPVKALNCKNKCCETHTYEKNHHYNKINNDGNVNKVEICYDHNNEIYKISLASRITNNTPLIKNWKSIFDSLKQDKQKQGIKIETGFFKAYNMDGTYIEFIDTNRVKSLSQNQNKKNKDVLVGLKNF